MENKMERYFDMRQFLVDRLKKIGVSICDSQVDQFLRFYDILLKWNKVMNLTAITDYEDVVNKHFIDSISLIKVIDKKFISSGSIKVIDIGTGAGFPGIPLKIMFPELNITLLDSLNKRISFLNEVIRELGFSDIEAIHGRAEDLAKKDKYREKYDLCVSRAVANLAVLSEYSLPYVRKSGYFISYKSGEIKNEIEESTGAINKLGGNIEDVFKFYLPETDIQRSLIKIKKINDTPKIYPRKAGIPVKEPLK